MKSPMVRRVINRCFNTALREVVWPFLPSKRPSLAIVDDCFPNRLSTFRIAEFNHYLRELPGAHIYTTHEVPWPVPGGLVRCEGANYHTLLQDYTLHFPEYASRVSQLTCLTRVRPGAFYFMFLSNAVRFLPLVKHARCPFIVTLYPGGGFALNNKLSDRSLRAVTSSKWLHSIITTQSTTRDYLLSRKFVSEAHIKHIYGGVLPVESLSQTSARVARTSNFTNICFVANKYSPKGADKGFPGFIAAARILAAKYANVRFHIVGSFTPADANEHDISKQMTFYGVQPAEFFPEFYANMDFIISPNRPNVLGPGLFDGFPTGACVEAAVCGVALVCTDELKMNPGFVDGEEILLVTLNPTEIAERVAQYIENPRELEVLKQRGQQRMLYEFSLLRQMTARMDVIRQVVAL